MKKLFALVICFIFMVAPAYAGPSFSAGGGGGGSAGSLTIATDCSSVVAEGAMCWDSDNNVFYIGDGAAAAPIGPGAGAGTITNVWTVATGNVNALVAASGDSFSAASADSSIPWVVATDCSAVTADGRACWDSDDNILYIGDGATQVKIIKSGAIVNADIAAAAAVAWSKMAALTSAHILVGNGSNVATDVAVSGDVTIANTGAVTIGDDKILEKHLKATNSATDEYILTYESTGGDFEWHSIAEMLAKIGDTRGSVLRRGATGWEAVTPGTVSYPLVSAGAGADPAYSQIVAAGITNNTITAAQLAATLTFSDGDLIDLSGITQSADTNEGLILPTWANVTTTGVTNGAIAWDNPSLSLKVKSTGGWQSIGATAAPIDATYLTLSNNATLTGERVLTEGLAIDFTDSGADGTLTIAFDPTELTGDRTWAAGGAATVAWTWNVSTGTDPTITFGNDLITLSNSLTVATGKNVKVGTTQWNSGDSIDGTKVANADLGDITVTSGVWAVEDDSHAHTSSTLPATTAYTDAANQVFTGALQTFGDADTDQLKVRSMIYGGNSREVQINASTRTAPSHASATPTQDLFVAGNIETPGIIYSAGLNTGTGTDGTRAITMVNNDSVEPTPSGNMLYFYGNVLKVVENGTAKEVPLPADTVTWTGSYHDFTATSGLRLPTSQPDVNGEVAINNTSEQLQMYINSALKTFDFTGDSSGYVLKSDGSGNFTLQADATGGSPTLNSVANPTGDTTIAMDAGEEVNFDYTGNFTTGSQFKIEQKTGNPSGGVLFEVKAADTDVTLARLGDGTNYIEISKAGNLSHGGTSVLTAPRVATSIAPSAAGGSTLGTTALEWGHAYFTDSAVIYGQADQSATLTSSASKWTANNFGVTTAVTMPATISNAAAATWTLMDNQASGLSFGATGAADILKIGTLDAGPTVAVGGALTATTINGHTLTAGSSTFTGTAGQTYTFPTTTATLARTDAGQTFTGVQAFTAPTVATSIAPASADGATLGTASFEFSDLYLADGGIIYLGNDQDVTLSHVADTGLLLSGAGGTPATRQLQFGDSGTYVNQPADGYIGITGDTGVSLKAGAEDIRLTAGTNIINVTSSTGVTDLVMYGATTADPLNLATTGTIRGAIKVIDMGSTAGTYAVTAADAYGSLFKQTHGDGATVVTLPDYQATAEVDHVKLGASVCFSTKTAYATVVTASADDKIRSAAGVLSGAAGTCTGPATVGAFACFILDETATDVGIWQQYGTNGAWVTSAP